MGVAGRQERVGRSGRRRRIMVHEERSARGFVAGWTRGFEGILSMRRLDILVPEFVTSD